MATDRRYTGQRWEGSVGFYDYGARSYDPALGRFLQADTIVPNPANPQSLNRYAYVYNRPLNYVDSGGHNPIPIVLVVVVASKVIDYGWTLYDMGQSSMVLADVNASRDDKMMAVLNIGLAVLSEGLEPDDTLPVGLPIDDATRYTIMQGAKEAFAEGGEEALERFLRDNLGEQADDVLRQLRNLEDDFAGELPPQPLGRGSTGRSAPNNLVEQLAMEQAMSDPKAGGIMEHLTLTDPRWLCGDGWVKMYQNINGVEIHYVFNAITGAVDDFKFK